jgi:uncharacterized membrane protein
MTAVETTTLLVHVGAGALALLAGVGALATEKGGPRHRQSGRTFVRAMAVVVATSLLLFALDPTSFRGFLALVAVFSGYLAFSGYRVLARKRPDDGAGRVDWAAAACVLLACLGMAGWGVVRLTDGSTFGSVLVVFGGIGVAMGGNDARRFQTDDGPTAWVPLHLTRMIAAFIATVSAVSAVNLTGALGFLAWLWPTILGTPLIAYWARRYD